MKEGNLVQFTSNVCTLTSMITIDKQGLIVGFSEDKKRVFVKLLLNNNPYHYGGIVELNAETIGSFWKIIGELYT